MPLSGGSGCRAERLEDRRLLAFDLVAAFASSDQPFYASGITTGTPIVSEPPPQVTLRFSPGVRLDAGSVGGVTIVRAGADGAFGTADDAALALGGSIGFIGVDDAPNQNQLVIRFAETLPDGLYRINVGAGLASVNSGAARPTSVDVRLDRGAYVMAVVPQPITRTGTGQLVQSRNTIAVHFNREDPLDPASAQDVRFYRLIEVDPNGADTGAPLVPATVTYAAATGLATLSFATNLPEGKLFRLEIGGSAAVGAIVATESAQNNSSFLGAQDLGALSSGGISVTGSIDVQPIVATPAGALLQPSPDGARDEQGHRDHPDVDSHQHGDQFIGAGPASQTKTRFYNFKARIGSDPQGNTLFNLITETQKERAREVFDLFSQYTGVSFVETADIGLTVATGDLRAMGVLLPDTIAGVGGPVMSLMNSSLDWGESEYGGQWFIVAMHEIGHSLGLEHSYDLPSIMGAGLGRGLGLPANPGVPVESVFPGDYDIGHLRQIFPNHGSDIDMFRFQVVEPGRLAAETVIARPGQPAMSPLDSVLTLYRQNPVTGRHEVIARNDDYYGRDSFVGLDLEPGGYFLAVTSTGNTSFNPEVPDSGFGGRSEGAYELRLAFTPASRQANTVVDATGTPLDGDRDGKSGGLFRFWFNTAAPSDTIFVDRANTQPGTGAGTLANPFKTISAAVAAANVDPGKRIIRIVGNTAGVGGTPLPYEVGTTLAGAPLRDGATFDVPAGVTVMIDAGAVLKLRSAIIDVGSSSPLVSRAGAAIQVLGTPGREVVLTSWHDDSIGGNSDGTGPAVQGGQWGGIVLRSDSDAASRRAFVNTIGLADIRYGGGQVLVESQLEQFAPIQLESARPTVVFNSIRHSAGAGIAATPNSFEDSADRLGPEFRGNTLRDNSINGLFVKIETRFGTPIDKLDVPARFTSTDIVHVIAENFVITGGSGGYLEDGGNVIARATGRLTVDPGVVVKLQSSRIELERGRGRLYAEGLPSRPVIFTSLGDNRFGAGGTFDTNGNLPDQVLPGDWGGIVINAGAAASIDHAYLGFGGGTTPIEGTFDQFNVIEVHQGDLRLANSRVERNASGLAASGRNGRGGNAAAAVFVRGAQPVIVGNDFRENAGAVVSINVNSMTEARLTDPGRGVGGIGRFSAFDDNAGPLVRGNVLTAATGGVSILGMHVRGEEITTESVWDDTDIVHVLQSQIRVENFHSATGVRLVSRPGASLVVKLDGPDAGFTAAGYPLNIDDRIGGTVQVIGQPGYPVILTSLRDDTAGAGIDPLGRLVTDTNGDGTATAAAPGDWRSLQFLPYSNDRNVAVVIEAEPALNGGIDTNGSVLRAMVLGTLAPNFSTGANTWESAQEKSGDENRRLGFEVHGFISPDDPADADVYSFLGFGGSEVWIDLDKTATGLDAMVELLNSAGQVIARSADAQTDAALSPSTTGLALPPEKDAWRPLDHHSQNRRDPGMRVILPNARGSQSQYFVRVRSQPRYDGSTTQAAYEADLRAASPLVSGATSGGYQLRIRLRQLDEKPGSTVQYADIRYATIGIDVQGLPRNSLLLGETGESSTDANNSFANAQYVGNLLESDRATISVAGEIATPADVDWYTFALNFEQIQSVQDGFKSWATVFDIDYGAGIRGDLTISVFDQQGRLIYVGRDSNVADDQPAAGQGNDFDDLSRGSVSPLDPFIGSVQLPAGLPTGSGSIEGNSAISPPDPARQLRYYVAVSSNKRLPDVLAAFYRANPTDTSTDTLVRLEPVNSVRRVAEDHIGPQGYFTGPEVPPFYPLPVFPETRPLFDIETQQSLSLHATPFTLADVTLFVYSATSIVTVDPMRGGVETVLSSPMNNLAGDIAMRSDGRLFQYRPLSNAGGLYELNTWTGGATLVGDDNIPVPQPPAPVAVGQETLAPQQLGGQTSTFNLANAGLNRATANGSLRYTDATAGVGGTPVTYTWSFVSNAAGVLTFTNVPTPAPPPGFAAPTGGTLTVGAYAGNVLQNAVATINWSAPIDMTRLQISIQYNYQTPPPPNPNAVQTDVVDALAFTGGPSQDGPYQLYYSVSVGGGSALYRANPATGDASTTRIGDELIGSGLLSAPVGRVTGLAFVNNNPSMYGVDTQGNFFRFGSNNGQPTPGVTVLNTILDEFGNGISFQGLAVGPQNLQGGRFANVLFAIDAGGTLYAFNTAGVLQTVFDSDNNGSADATSISSGASGALGLAFSPLDINLWHPTIRRGRDAGHGINRAPDFSRELVTDDDFVITAQGEDFVAAEGAISMYFGLERYVRPQGDTFTPYLNYESLDGQLGVLNGGWQEDLTSNPEIRNNYNLPGGAHGSLVTNPFSLAGSTYGDKPTLYFNYWLQTENASSPWDENWMRDSARVLISADDGLTWQLIATNNSERSDDYTFLGELPAFVSASANLITPKKAGSNQHVQELYDSGQWRQGRIDLGEWAGRAGLRLRFDFSTAGEFDPSLRDANGRLLNDISGFANTTGDFAGSLRSRERGANNAHEGFYIDDVIIGYAERGEMVTAAPAARTGFFEIVDPGPDDGPDYTLGEQKLTGPYQLEIRRGTEYAVQPRRDLPDIAIQKQFNTNASLVPSSGFVDLSVGLSIVSMPLLGDANRAREQGQFIVANNLISDAASFGIRIDAGIRDAGTNTPFPGVPRNLPTLNGGRLAPGAVVMNNVIAGSGSAGILVSGDPNTGNVPVAAVPFVRIVNNTIYGGAESLGTGVQVTENAGPTLINNLFAKLATAVSVDNSSRLDAAGNQRTVVGASAYFDVAIQVAGGSQTFPLVLTGDPFVNAATRNFYLRPGTGAIDSALNSLQDRTEYRVVNSGIGVGQFPILSPDRDLYGQLRSDDPLQASAPGLGANVFKDRGAIDRVDFTQPFARIDVPQDNGLNDLDPADDLVRLRESSARGLTAFVLHLQDVGIGIDPATVSSTAFRMTRDGTLLVPGVDYVFEFNALTMRVAFQSPSVFALGSYQIRVEQEGEGAAARNVIKDLAGNPLLPNRLDGTTVFTIELVDVPLAPTGLVASSGDGLVSLGWTAPSLSGAAVTGYELERATDAAFTSPTRRSIAAPATSFVDTPLANGTQYWYRLRAVGPAGESGWSNVAGPVVPLSIPSFALASDTGASSSDGVTSNGLVNVSGVLAGSTWEYSINGGTSWTTGSGSSFTLPANATYATGSVRVRQVASASLSSAFFNTSAITIDTIAPAAPALALGTGVTDGADLAEATQASGVVRVTGEPGATITVTFTRGVRTVTKQVTGTGGSQPVSLTTTDVQIALGSGTIVVSATQTDLAGNAQTSPPSTTSFTLLPAPPVISSAIDDRPNNVGVVANGGATNDTELQVVGTAEPGSTVTLRSGATVVGIATANGSGNWEVTTSRLADGPHSLTATLITAGGVASGVSQPYAVTVDTVRPERAAISSVIDDFGTVQGSVPFGGRTDDTTLRVSGIAEPNSLVVVRSERTILRRTYADAFGNWSLTTPVLPVQVHKLNAYARDAAGNVGVASPNHTLTIDQTPPTITSFGTTAVAGTFGPGAEIPIHANASERMLAGSAIDVTLNTGAVVRLTTPTDGNRLSGTYRVPGGTFASTLSIVGVANVTPIASDIAGNPVASLPAVPFVLGGISIDSTIRAFATGFSSNPAAPSIRNAAVTQIQIVFSTEVEGVSIAALRLLYNERETISLRSATITGSGRTYTLTLPANLTNRLGSYRLVIGPSSAIRAIDGGSPMDLESNVYWNRI